MKSLREKIGQRIADLNATLRITVLLNLDVARCELERARRNHRSTAAAAADVRKWEQSAQGYRAAIVELRHMLEV